MDEQTAVQRLVAALRELQKISDYYSVNRGIGHTAAMVSVPGDGTIIVTDNYRHAEQLRQRTSGTHQGVWDIMGRASFSNREQAPRPLLIDHYALQGMISDARGDLVDATRELLVDLQAEHRSELVRLRAQHEQEIRRFQNQRYREMATAMVVWDWVLGKLAGTATR